MSKELPHHIKALFADQTTWEVVKCDVCGNNFQVPKDTKVPDKKIYCGFCCWSASYPEPLEDDSDD